MYKRQCDDTWYEGENTKKLEERLAGYRATPQCMSSR
jgi:hypothetical protein